MKKFIALMLSVMMVLSISAVSLAEAAEAYEPEVQYTTFAEHLSAFLNNVNLQEKDLGTLQIDSEAAYLSYQGSNMALRFDTVQSFIQNLPQKLMGYLQQFGIDPQQLMADFQTLAALSQKLADKIAPSFQQTVDGDVTTITLDAESYANLYAEAIDELMADASFQDILARYLPLFGTQFDAEQYAASWQQSRDQVI